MISTGQYWSVQLKRATNTVASQLMHHTPPFAPPPQPHCQFLAPSSKLDLHYACCRLDDMCIALLVQMFWSMPVKRDGTEVSAVHRKGWEQQQYSL